MTILMVAIVSIGFVSCGDDDDDEEQVNPIVGTWTYVERNWSEMCTFKSDGTFKLIWQEEGYSGEESGTWNYNANDHKLTMTTVVGEKLGSHTYTVILQGNQMTLIEADGDVWGPYTKQ